MTKQTKKIIIRPADQEQIWGLVYLLFSVFLLPALLRQGNTRLPAPLNSSWFNFVYFICNFLFVFWIYRKFWKRSLIQAGQHFWDFWLGVILGAVGYWLLSFGLSILIHWIDPAYQNLNDSAIQGMAQGEFWILFVGSVCFVPLAEETLYRGLVFGALYPKNAIVAYTLSAAIFSAIHIIGYLGLYSTSHLVLAFIQYLPAGFALAWSYSKSGSIFAPILIHAINNAIGLLSMR